MPEENQYEPCYCYFCQRRETILRREYFNDDEFDAIDDQIVESHAGYTKYSDETAICWLFECTCPNDGDCNNCKMMSDYNDSLLPY